jgi:outer membrane receptor protein involved in Fe transport
MQAVNSIEEVIVTSQRVEESLQDVPIAVTALTADMLEDQQIQSGSDLQLVTPSLSFQGGDAGGGTFNIGVLPISLYPQLLNLGLKYMSMIYL